MAISDSQKVDLLYKKIAWAVAKTDTNPPKEAYNETNPSPLLIRGDVLWQLSGSIPASIPATTSSIVQVYKDGGGSYSPTVECTELAVTDNRTWSTGLTDWISQEFGSTYFVKVYIDTAGSTTPQTTGTALQAAGVNDDQWFFDYQAGILNFIGTNLPTAIATGVTGKSIFISGARYIGPKGVTSWSNGLTIGNVTINGNTITGNTGVSFGGNITTANIILTNNMFWSNGVSALAPTYGNTQVAQYLPVYTGNISAGNVNVTGNVSAAYVLGDGSKLTGMPEGYTNANVDAYLPTYTGNISSGNINVTGNVRGNIFADVISPYQTGITAFNSNTAIGLPVGDNSSRPTGVTGYFRYSTTGAAPEYYNGTDWVSVNSTVTGQSFSGDGSNTVYTLDQDASNVGILVSINGTLQQPGVAYTVSGDQITFAEIPLTTDVIDIRFLGALVTTSQIVDDLTVSGNIISGNILPSANVTYGLGSANYQWKDLWVSSNTIYIGNTPLTVSNGSVLVNGVASYANTNVAAYLTTATITTTGNVSASNVIATGNVSASGIGAFYAANRPAFRIVGNGGAITATANVTSSNFTVDYNQGSYLNTTTGFFTAPVAGLYQVNLLTRANSNTNGVIAQSVIQHNYSGGNQVAIMIEYGTNTSMNHTGGSTIVKMAVGDTLQMRVLVGTISFDGNDNWSVAYIG